MKWGDERLPERFWANGKRVKGHWLWTRKLTHNGYGVVKYKGQTWRVHRLIFTIVHGPITHHVLHECDIPSCFNPKCLFEGTHQENMADRDSKGRLSYGDHGPLSKLSENRVQEIRQLYSSGGYFQRELAEMFGVNQSMISKITRKTSWKRA